jgi:hypothetical protein
MVGGFPQTSLFKARGPRTGINNLRLVGDSVFPGQSTAGVTLGGLRVAEDVKRHLPVFSGKTNRHNSTSQTESSTPPKHRTQKSQQPQKETLHV